VSKPRMLVIEDSSKATFGGGQKVTLAYIEAVNKSFDVDLLDFAAGTLFLTRSRPKVRRQVSLGLRGRISGGKNSSFSLGFTEVVTSPYWILRAVVSGVRLQRDNHYDLLFAATKRALIVASVVGLICRRPYIFHAHTLDRKHWLYSPLIKLMLIGAAKTICVSKCVKDSLGLFRSTVVYNPIEPVDATVRELADKVVVTSFCTLLPWKGIENLVLADDFLPEQTSVEIRIYGEGPLFAELLALSRNRKRVSVLGFESNVPRRMAEEATIVCIPSVSAEACPMTAIESLSYGIPVITTDFGGQAEIVGTVAGILVSPGTPKAIADAILAITSTPVVYRRFSDEALKRAVNFERKNILKRYEEISLRALFKPRS